MKFDTFFNFLKLPSSVIVAFTLLTHWSLVASPNVLFIAVDDLNDWIGCMKGHPQAHTPNMDQLAKRGVLFTNAHCVAPACRPSRSAIFTGKFPHQTGAWSNESQDIIKAYPRADLLPYFLADHGYRTFGTGKLFHGGGTEHFQYSYKTEQRWSPFTSAQASYSKEELPTKGSANPRHFIHNGPGGQDYVLPLNGLRSERNPHKLAGESFDWGPFVIEDLEMGDTRITDWAMNQLDSEHNQPFFLGVGYYRPHIPLFAPRMDFNVYPPVEEIHLPSVIENDLADLSDQARRRALEPITAGSHEIVEKSNQWQTAVRAYLACVTYVDRQLGRLLNQLDKSDHADNTWIILWSDHGWHLGEKRHWGKWTGWRESTRVPLIIVPPLNEKNTPRGQHCSEPVSLLDLYPTLIDICELPAKRHLSGQSLMSLIRSPKNKTNRQAITLFNPGNIAITGHRWKYIQYSDHQEELYNLQDDPNEWRNLADEKVYSKVLESFRQKVSNLN